MNVLVQPTGLHSQAMVRVARALARYAPSTVKIVFDQQEADLVISHVIGPDGPPEKDEIVIQYCLKSAGLSFTEWVERWKRSKFVWSYFNLPAIVQENGFKFYHAPLGVDEVFAEPFVEKERDIGILTSGFVSAPIAEAIEEVAMASWLLEMSVMHLGPAHVEGMKVQPTSKWQSVLGISDRKLAAYYRRCKWVSGLRHIEGFELPVLEGLCCGARPIVFDRPEMREWYNGHAVFIPECSGTELVKILLDVMSEEPEPVTSDERHWAIQRFSWEPIAKAFWGQLS